MNLRQINDLWNEYKEKYDLPEDIQISVVTVMPALFFSMNLLIFMIS